MADALSVVILAAGYGTRLGAIGRSRPKALLPLGGRPLVAHLLEEVEGIPGLAEVRMVVNARFRDPLETWAREDGGGLSVPLRILDNGTTSPSERLGAVGDLAFALDHVLPGADILVLVTDTLFDFSIQDFVEEFRSRPPAEVLLAVLEETDPVVLQRRGVVSVDGHGRIVRFQEKPDRPSSTVTAAPVYLFRSAIIPLVTEYLEAGGNPDAPGHLLEWLVDIVRVEAWRASGGRIDVGTPEGYRLARRRFQGRRNGRDAPEPADDLTKDPRPSQ